MKLSFNKTIILISGVLISLFLVSLVALAALKIETQLDMASNKIVNLATPTIDSDAATLGSVLAAEGNPVFTKCQMKHTSSPTYPSCPPGWTSIHSYASMKYQWDQTQVACDCAEFTWEDVTDTTWWYEHWTGTYDRYKSIYACTVCEKI